MASFASSPVKQTYPVKQSTGCCLCVTIQLSIPLERDILIESLGGLQHIRNVDKTNEEFWGEENSQPLEKDHSLLALSNEERRGFTTENARR